MRLKHAWAHALGALVVAACGSDGGDDGDKSPGVNTGSPSGGGGGGNDNTVNPVGGGGACGKGALDVGTGELDYCDPSDSDESCPSTEKLVGYSAVDGDLNIYPGSGKDLSHASCLQTVAGTLSISEGSDLTSLEGLESLKSVRALEVLGLDKLTSLSGIDKLTRVNSLTINGNKALTDIEGLPSGFEVGSLYVAGNLALASLDGLDGITVTDVIAIEKNPKLSSCKVAAFAKKFPAAKLSNTGNLTETCD
jgi:hypothetical protein